MKSQTYYLPDEGLIIEVVLDPITLDLIIDLKKQERAAGWIKPGTNLLVSVNQNAVEITAKEFIAYSEWSAKNLPELKGSKVAVIVTTPILSALNMILADTLKKEQRDIRVFSTLRAAANWLHVAKETILTIAPGTKLHDLN